MPYSDTCEKCGCPVDETFNCFCNERKTPEHYDEYERLERLEQENNYDFYMNPLERFENWW